MGYFKLIVLLILLLCNTGCIRIISPSGVDQLKRNLGDLKALSDPSVIPSEHSQSAAHSLADSMALAMGIDVLELPGAAITKPADWNNRPAEAKADVDKAIKTDSSLWGGWLEAAKVVGGLALGIALRQLGSAHPALGLLTHFIGLNMHPREKTLRNKLEVAVNNACEDPKFIDSPVGQELSKVMTPTEKLYIKDKKARTYYAKSRRSA